MIYSDKLRATFSCHNCEEQEDTVAELMTSLSEVEAIFFVCVCKCCTFFTKAMFASFTKKVT